MQNLKALIYVSTAAEHIQAMDVARIIERSEENNKRSGVCGMLLYSKGQFMQCIEGTTMGVEHTLGKILQSCLHHSVVELFKGEVTERRFSSWDWAYYSGSTKQFSSPEIQYFLESSACTDPVQKNHIEQSILTTFWQGSADSNHFWTSR